MPRSGTPDQTFSGGFSSDTDIRVANLTITGGRVVAGYSMEVLYLPAGDSSGLRCGMVDTSGRIDFFELSQMVAAPGEWQTLAFEASFDLPDLTLGIRCSPNADGAMTVVFRDATLHATPAD